MPASFLSRHRTICDTIQEIREIAERGLADELSISDSENIIELCVEATTYGRAMSAKLQEYKDKYKDET